MLVILISILLPIPILGCSTCQRFANQATGKLEHQGLVVNRLVHLTADMAGVKPFHLDLFTKLAHSGGVNFNLTRRRAGVMSALNNEHGRFDLLGVGQR